MVEYLIDDAGSTHMKASQEVGSTIGIMKMTEQFPMQMETTLNQSMIAGKTNLMVRKAAGVVGIIGPFNFPLYLSMRSVARALATGNAVVLKTSSATSVSGRSVIAKTYEEAGLPKMYYNLLCQNIQKSVMSFMVMTFLVLFPLQVPQPLVKKLVR